MIELPRASLLAGEIAEIGRVLFVRHQRSDADDFRHFPRRRRDLPRHLYGAGHLAGRPLRLNRSARASANWCASASSAGAKYGPSLRLAFAASTAAIRRPSPSSTPPSSITCRARRSACRSRGWPRRRLLSARPRQARRKARPPPGRESPPTSARRLETAVSTVSEASRTTSADEPRFGRRSRHFAEHGDDLTGALRGAGDVVRNLPGCRILLLDSGRDRRGVFIDFLHARGNLADRVDRAGG